MKDILKGAYDLHVHTAPDVVERRYSDLQFAERVSAAGMKGFAIKAHHFNTAGRARLVGELHTELTVVGGLTLNLAMGGLNPAAVELAGRQGGKIVWFPTTDGYHEKTYLEAGRGGKPYGSGGDFAYERKGIRILEDGKLAENVEMILELIKKYDMVLATGHIAPEEALALIRAGHSAGLERMIATHVSFPMTFTDTELQKEYIRLGAMIEHCAYTFYFGKTPYSLLYEQLRETGCGRVLLSSDMGQKNSPPPDEGLAEFAEKLLREGGVSEKDLERMLCINPEMLVK